VRCAPVHARCDRTAQSIVHDIEHAPRSAVVVGDLEYPSRRSVAPRRRQSRAHHLRRKVMEVVREILGIALQHRTVLRFMARIPTRGHQSEDRRRAASRYVRRWCGGCTALKTRSVLRRNGLIGCE
jgi:hypothetical protein